MIDGKTFFFMFIEKLGSEKMKTFFGGIMSLGVQIKSKAIIFSWKKASLQFHAASKVSLNIGGSLCHNCVGYKFMIY